MGVSECGVSRGWMEEKVRERRTGLFRFLFEFEDLLGFFPDVL